MPVPASAPPRWLIYRVAALAVACRRAGLSFERAALEAPGLDQCLPGLDPPTAPADLEAFAILAEARARDCTLKRLERLAPERFEVLEGLTENPGAALEEARIAINAPKVWAAVRSVAGALQARAPLTFEETADKIDWTLEN